MEKKKNGNSFIRIYCEIIMFERTSSDGEEYDIASSDLRGR